VPSPRGRTNDGGGNPNQSEHHETLRQIPFTRPIQPDDGGRIPFRECMRGCVVGQGRDRDSTRGVAGFALALIGLFYGVGIFREGIQLLRMAHRENLHEFYSAIRPRL